LIALGELDQAQALLDSIPLNDATLRQIGERTAWTARAELHLARNEPHAAHQLVEKLIDAAPNVAQGGVIPRLWHLRARVLIALARGDEAERLLQTASRTAQAELLLPSLWRIELDLGKLYHRQGKPQQAQTHYDAARAGIDALAHKMGDDVRRRQFLAVATGLIPTTPPPTSAQLQKAVFGGLTKREREVAAFIARGLTNKAIADTLIVSERTVEKHVENVMGKLGFTTRSQVAVWAAENGLMTQA
jgi:DNA-binding CsgD family transcriptional regulator